MVSITAVPIMTDPTDRVGVTVEGLAGTEQLITVWRRWDSEREAVSGARRISVVDSFYIDDFKAPLGRSITYELEVLSGPHAGVQGITATSFLASTSGWISDPLAPSMSVRVHGVKVGDETYFRSEAFAKIGRNAKVNNFDIMGATKPVSLGGIRQAASGVPLSMTTKAEAENVRLRDMVNGTAHLIIRPLPEWGSFLPGTATYAAGDMDEIPVTVMMGGSLTRWESTGDVVRGSSARVVIALWTYQQVEEIYATYDQKQAAAGAGAYLDDQKNPANV